MGPKRVHGCGGAGATAREIQRTAKIKKSFPSPMRISLLSG